MCSVDGCDHDATVEVFLYDVYFENFRVFFERDTTRPFLCGQHMIDNERESQGIRKPRGMVTYPYLHKWQLCPRVHYLSPIGDFSSMIEPLVKPAMKGDGPMVSLGSVTLADVEGALDNLGGEAEWSQILAQLTRIRNGDYTHYLHYESYEKTAFQVIQRHCLGYEKYLGPTRFEKIGKERFRVSRRDV
jgi:hypothetical protein